MAMVNLLCTWVRRTCADPKWIEIPNSNPNRGGSDAKRGGGVVAPQRQSFQSFLFPSSEILKFLVSKIEVRNFFSKFLVYDEGTDYEV
jgi:hypothetical protein